MKILFITPIDPMEDWHGGAVRTRFLWKSLMRIGEVYTSVVGAEKIFDDENKIRYVPQFSGIKTRIAMIKLAMMSVFVPWLDWAFQDREFILEKLGWSNEWFDKVVVRLPQFMAANWLFLFEVPYWKIAPTYVDIDDLPSEDFNTTRRKYFSPKRGLLYYWLNVAWQSFLYRKSKGAWIANQFQKNYVRWFCKCVYLPNVVRLPARCDRSKVSGKRQILTVGFMGHPPNVTGLDWFLKDVWPQVYKRFQELEFVIVGSKMTDEMRERWSKIDGVVVRGYVENLGEAYAATMAVVVPILTGGGTCVKLIEALSYGKKVLATPFGARGLSARQIKDAHISIFNNAVDFCQQVEEYLFAGEGFAGSVCTDARSMVKRDYAEEFFDHQVGKLLKR